MKLKIFTLLGVAFAFTSFAQPTLLRTNFVNTGTTETIRLATVASIDTSIQGANVTWNYTGLVADASEPAMVVTYIDPANTPYKSSFSTSNYCYKEDDGVTKRYVYFSLTDEKLERVGSITVGEATNIYSDPQIEMVFPFTMGTTSMDTWESTSSSFGGTYAMECVGYGTLNLPNNKTYTNVMMVRVMLYELFEVPVYFWYSENGAMLLQYIVGDDFFIPEMVKFTTALTTTTTGVNEINQNNIKVSLTNPVTDKLDMTLATPASNDIEYSIVNMMGVLVKSGQISKGESTVSVQMNDLASGIYYFTSSGEQDIIQSIKILKQ